MKLQIAITKEVQNEFGEYDTVFTGEIFTSNGHPLINDNLRIYADIGPREQAPIYGYIDGVVDRDDWSGVIVSVYDAANIPNKGDIAEVLFTNAFELNGSERFCTA